MDRLPQGTLVTPDGTGAIESGWVNTTGATPILRTIGQSDRRAEGFPTAGTVGWRNQTDQAPTLIAKTLLPRRGNGLSAIDTVLRQDDIDQSAANAAPHLPHPTPHLPVRCRPAPGLFLLGHLRWVRSGVQYAIHAVLRARQVVPTPRPHGHEAAVHPPAVPLPAP